MAPHVPVYRLARIYELEDLLSQKEFPENSELHLEYSPRGLAIQLAASEAVQEIYDQYPEGSDIAQKIAEDYPDGIYLRMEGYELKVAAAKRGAGRLDLLLAMLSAARFQGVEIEFDEELSARLTPMSLPRENNHSKYFMPLETADKVKVV